MKEGEGRRICWRFRYDGSVVVLTLGTYLPTYLPIYLFSKQLMVTMFESAVGTWAGLSWLDPRLLPQRVDVD